MRGMGLGFCEGCVWVVGELTACSTLIRLSAPPVGGMRSVASAAAECCGMSSCLFQGDFFFFGGCGYVGLD